MPEILTTEQVANYRCQWADNTVLLPVNQFHKLCDGYEKLRAHLVEGQQQRDVVQKNRQAQAEHDAERLADALQQLMDEQVRGSAVCTAWALAMQEMEADVRALAEAIIEYRMAQNPHNLHFPEMQPVTKALARPGVQRLLAKKKAE